MKIDIHQPVGFTQVGQRANNEDSIFPHPDSVATNTRLFLVCDGVGGQHKGEVASELACESMQSFFGQFPIEVSDEQFIRKAIEYTVGQFANRELSDRETKGMATTLTLLHFNDAGATIAHLGDSRIYQVRNGRILRVSEDHKLVNELVRDGHITKEESLTHSQRNVITKVISADRIDIPDVKIINDIKAGDYFFLCSDGVLEQLYDDLLAYHLRDTPDNAVSDDQKMENIRLECEGRTRDNFSAYLIKVKNVTGTLLPQHTFTAPSVETFTELPVAEPVFNTYKRPNYEMDSPTQFTRPAVEKIGETDNFSLKVNDQKRSGLKSASTKKINIYPYIIGLFIGIVIAYIGFGYLKKKTEASISNTPAEIVKPATLEPPVIEGTNEKTEAIPPISRELKRENVVKPVHNVIDTIAHSKKENFYILKDGKQYFTWEPVRKKKTSIEYDQLASIPDLLHHYRFKSSRQYYIFLDKPDIKIANVDSIETSIKDFVYYTNGNKYKIDTKSGMELNQTGQELKEKLKNDL